MQLLVIGGSGFLGGAITRAGLAAGHSVTVLSRGKAVVPAGASSIVADRNAPLPAFDGFDAVLDTCAYTPDGVTHALDAVGNALPRYVMISSISAYSSFRQPGQDEDGPTEPATDAEIEAARADPTTIGAAYGPLKRSSELAAITRLGERATLIRPGLIVGPGDPTDRFTYWVRRVDLGGPVPLPGPVDRPAQFIDVEDVADFVLRCAERNIGGAFNVTGPSIPFAQMMLALAQRAGQAFNPVWMPLDAFTDQGIGCWIDLPLILPDDPDMAHMQQVSINRAIAAGLRLRPLAETADRILHWDRARRDQPMRAGMTPAAEAALLG